MIQGVLRSNEVVWKDAIHNIWMETFSNHTYRATIITYFKDGIWQLQGKCHNTPEKAITTAANSFNKRLCSIRVDAKRILNEITVKEIIE